MTTTHTQAEIAAAEAAYAQASPEERAEFEKDWPAFHEAAHRFAEWREHRRQFASATSEERAAFEAAVREQGEKFAESGERFSAWMSAQKLVRRAERLKSLGFSGDVYKGLFGGASGDVGQLAGLSDHVWEQVSSLITGGHIKPEPPATCSATG